MIHEIGVELNAALAAKGCPVKVLDGPERTQTTTFGRERITIERDYDGGDTFAAVRSSGKRAPGQPDHRFTRGIGAKITIYAQATSSGALQFEHERRAEHILDLVLVGLDNVIRKRANAWRQTSGRFTKPVDLAPSEVLAGSVYELKFSVDRAVMERPWDGAAISTAPVTDGFIKSETDVKLFHGPSDEIAETACGGA